MSSDQRARFYEGQYLSPDDLSTAEEYARILHARHALGAHTWGIAIGLDLVQRTLPSGDVENVIMPGYAWDGYGRAIVVLAPVKLSPQLFANYQGTTPADGLLVKIWIRYAEQETQNPAPGFEVCGVADQAARIVETYAVEVGEPMAGPEGPVSVAGSDIDALAARNTFDAKAPDLFDESVPHQDFPPDDKPQWLVPIGYVRWLKPSKKPGRFAPRIDTPAGTNPKDSDVIREFRRYIGLVAETLDAPDGVIRLRDRGKDPDPDKTYFHPPWATDDPKNPNDLLWVEGNLRVQGDARVAGGQIELRTKRGLDADTPTFLRRRGDSGKAEGQTGGRRLQAIIGKPGQDDSRFAVGPIKDDGDVAERLSVLSNGKVGIDNESPVTRLHLRKRTALDEGDDGNGVTWSSFGENASYDGKWNQLDETKPGVNFHMSAEGNGQEFRFYRIEPNGANGRNIAAIGSQKSFVRESDFGIGNNDPVTHLHIQTGTAVHEGTDAEGTWSSFGQNAYYSAGWHRIDNKRPGLGIRLNPQGADGDEYHFTRIDKNGTVHDVAQIGTQTSFIADGKLGVGTMAPAAALDVNGRIVRRGTDFSLVVAAIDGQIVPVPWGSTDDWNIFVSPALMGIQGDNLFNAAISLIECSAKPTDAKNGFVVKAQVTLVNGGFSQSIATASCLLLPR